MGIAVLAKTDNTKEVIGGLLLLAAWILVFVWRWALARKRLIQDVPTSKVKGVAIGLSEIAGRAHVASPITSVLAEVPCGWYRYKIEEHYRRTRTDSKGKKTTHTGWENVASGEAECAFELEDDTGRIRVVPKGAEVTGREVFDRRCSRGDALYYGKGPSSAISGSTGERRFVEHAICTGDRLYVLGSARIRDDQAAVEIAKDDGGDPYLISTEDETAITSGLAWTSGLALFFGVVFAGVGPALLTPAPDAWIAVSLGAFLVVALVCYAMILFNGLVGVRQRMAKAWSLIDVQLQRRHDLIPRLVETVRGAAKHEKGVHESLAAMRSELTTTRGKRGAPGSREVSSATAAADEQTAVLTKLVGVVEAYPALKTDANFLALQRELTDTEDRIALARGFYNESVAVYNQRIAVVPDVLFAALCGYKRSSFYEIAEFERRPVKVDFNS